MAKKEKFTIQRRQIADIKKAKKKLENSKKRVRAHCPHRPLKSGKSYIKLYPLNGGYIAKCSECGATIDFKVISDAVNNKAQNMSESEAINDHLKEMFNEVRNQAQATKFFMNPKRDHKAMNMIAKWIEGSYVVQHWSKASMGDIFRHNKKKFKNQNRATGSVSGTNGSL